jgi:hypothetical protein
MSSVIASVTGEFRRYQALAEGAIAQLNDAEVSSPGPNGSSSIAVLVWHIAGNLRSRFTDFRTSDGEKPWRDRDAEFDDRTVSREELMARWQSGWQPLYATLDTLADDDLHGTVTIRGKSLSVHAALHRLLTHTSYHVGQIVYLAKAIRGTEWKNLSIPRGASATYNESVASGQSSRE